MDIIIKKLKDLNITGSEKELFYKLVEYILRRN